jgi:hypothetical protein
VSSETPPVGPLGGARRILFLLIPWLFVGLLALVAWRVVVPAVRGGALYGYVLAPPLALALVAFGAAAVTMSRDLLTGLYPAPDRGQEH